MSNPYGDDPSATGPTGPPPPPPNPYDSSSEPAAPAAPPSPPANPYTESPARSANPYGEAPPPEVPPQDVYGAPRPVDAGPRPGTVTAASVVTLLFSGLSALLFGLLLLGLVVARDDVVDSIDDEMANQPGMSDVSASDIANILAVAVVVLLVWCLVACLLAILVLRRSNAARIMLVVSASVTALLSLLGIASGISVVTLAAAVGVITMLFVGGANEWFRGQAPQPPQVPGMTRY